MDTGTDEESGSKFTASHFLAILARLVVACRRSGHLAAVRRVFDSKDMTRAIARFLARKLRNRRPVQAIRVDELRAAGRLL